MIFVLNNRGIDLEYEEDFKVTDICPLFEQVNAFVLFACKKLVNYDKFDTQRGNNER